MTGRSGIICAGNWIVDLVHDIEHWPAESDLVRIGPQTRGIGGGAANVIAALARFDTGIPLWPMGAVGDDDYGAFILDECRALGLPTSQLHEKAGIATAHTHVMSVAGQSRTFFYQAGANDGLSAVDFPAGTFAQTNARLFYLGYLTLLGELDRLAEDGTTDAARVLQRAQKAGLSTCVDLVSAHHPAFQAIVAAAAPFIDYLVVNEVEAARATGTHLTDFAASDPGALAALGRALVGYGVSKAAIVHSADLAVWCGAHGTEIIAAVDPLPPAEIASHLGAGDAFCAGLLYAVHEGWSPDLALQLANTAARASLRGVTATSAIPPLRTLGLEKANAT
ncbi:MAG: carbohydrate kinase family protein [Pseudomonadota bacterium]